MLFLIVKHRDFGNAADPCYLYVWLELSLKDYCPCICAHENRWFYKDARKVDDCDLDMNVFAHAKTAKQQVDITSIQNMCYLDMVLYKLVENII